MTDTSEYPPASPAEESAMASIRQERLPIGMAESNPAASLTVLRFGTAGARPKIVLQAGLHADELPGMLVLHDLATRLQLLEQRGEITGELILLPVANPLGLAQQRHGILQGRFDETTGENFNRGYPDLAAMICSELEGKLGPDAATNVDVVRQSMKAALNAIEPASTIDALRTLLLSLSCDADIVLDLHADNEALMHLYTMPAFWPALSDLAAELDTRAVLLADISGGNPFDEACSAPWLALAEAYPDVPLPPACCATTVELRSNNQVEASLSESDSSALLRFLQRRGAVAGEPGSLPRLLCEATPLEAMQQVKAPHAGIVCYHARLGDMLRAGDLVAIVVDPLGKRSEIVAETDGILFARHEQRYAWQGRVIGKIAGRIPLPDRVDNLLTD